MLYVGIILVLAATTLQLQDYYYGPMAHTYTYYFNNHFQRKPGLAGWPLILNLQSSFLIFCSEHPHRTGQNSSYQQSTLVYTPPSYTDHNSQDFWSRSRYRPNALPVTQPIASEHRRHSDARNKLNSDNWCIRNVWDGRALMICFSVLLSMF